MIPVLAAAGIGQFLSQMISHAYPNAFIAGLFFAIVVILLLVKIQAPASVTIMVALAVFAIIAGWNSPIAGIFISPVSSKFAPILAIVIAIVGGIFAYALWKMLRR
jgi:hypothetical protein